MRDQRAEVDAMVLDHRHQTAHAFLATGAQRRDDALIAQAGVNGLVGRHELAGIDAETRERTARADGLQRGLERLLASERLDRRVHAATARQPLDFRHGILLQVVDDDVGAEALRHREPGRHVVDGDDERGAPQLRAEGRAQADGALGEDGDRIADLDARALGAAQPGREDVGDQQHVLVAQAVGNGREVRLRVGHEQVFRPRPVDGVAEPPASQRSAALRVAAVQAVEALPAWRDRADHDPLADVVFGADPLAERVDDADRLVAEHQARSHGVLALDDVHVGPADRRRGDADDGLAGPGYRLRPLDHAEPPWLEERHCSHRVHRILLGRTLGAGQCRRCAVIGSRRTDGMSWARRDEGGKVRGDRELLSRGSLP